MVRELPVSQITETIERLVISANRHLPCDVACALKASRESEP